MIDEFRLIRSARVMLGWSPDDLAERSGVGTMTLFRVEAGHENVRVATIAALQSALEKGGIKFTPETDTSGPGIRFSTADMMANERSRMPLVLRRSEEHTSELQSLMRISYAVFCLKKKNTRHGTQDKKQ